MGREIVYCATCGTRILQEDFDQGKAITLNNKNYCPKCRKSVMPEAAPPAAVEEADLRPVAVDRGKGSSALRRAVNVPLSAATPARGSPALGGRPAGRPAARARGSARGAPRPAPNSSSLPIIVLVCVVVAALVLALVVLNKK